MTRRTNVARARIALALLLALLPRPAAALPTVGDARPEITLVDAWDRPLEIGSAANKPILVVYEDKESSKQNVALKEELARFAKGDRYKEAIALIAVADVDGYDYWPARGFVKSAIRGESQRFGTDIYCDWNGAARAKFGLKRAVSSVVLYGKNGRVLLAHEGAMPKEKREHLLELLRQQVAE